MKKTIFIFILLLISININAQEYSVGEFMEARLPDTLYIQYLSKSDTIAYPKYHQIFENALEEMKLEYEAEYYQANGKVRYLLKCSGENRWLIINIVSLYYPDAYYVDNRGWRVQY